MALITKIVAEHFRTGTDIGSVVMDLDTGIFTVGLAVQTLRDMVLHGSPGGGSKCDVDEVAAAAETLMAYLGHLGHLVDRLDALTGPRVNGGAQ